MWSRGPSEFYKQRKPSSDISKDGKERAVLLRSSRTGLRIVVKASVSWEKIKIYYLLMQLLRIIKLATPVTHDSVGFVLVNKYLRTIEFAD